MKKIVEKIRLEKYLSDTGLASRREAKKLIEDGLVTLNRKKVKKTGVKIDPSTDKVVVKKPKLAEEEKLTIAIYKPRGVVCAKEDDAHKTVFDVFKSYAHLNTVGRLDKESEGLLLLSNDGLVTKAVTGSAHLVEKEYVVTVRENILPWMIEKMERGIKIRTGMTLPAKAVRVNKHTFRITLKEGKKHQIRRMANALHLTIVSLKRVRIDTIRIGNMKPRNSRPLRAAELRHLKSFAITK